MKGYYKDLINEISCQSFLKESVVGYEKYGTKPRLVKLSF